MNKKDIFALIFIGLLLIFAVIIIYLAYFQPTEIPEKRCMDEREKVYKSICNNTEVQPISCINYGASSVQVNVTIIRGNPDFVYIFIEKDPYRYREGTEVKPINQQASAIINPRSPLEKQPIVAFATAVINNSKCGLIDCPPSPISVPCT